MAQNDSNRTHSEHSAPTDELLALMPFLKKFAMLLSKNEVRAEDLVQNTILRALANIDKFQTDTNMRAWLSTILRNCFYSEHRKYKREQEWDPDIEDAIMFSTGFGDGGGAIHDLHQLLLYITCLPQEQSDALIAIGYLGITYEEAAKILECKVGTIKSRVNRAREQLKLLMAETTVLKNVQLTVFKTATKRVPRNHPYFPIAKAYEELYATCAEVSSEKNDIGKDSASESEKLWEELVASGALDDISDDLATILQGDDDS